MGTTGRHPLKSLSEGTGPECESEARAGLGRDGQDAGNGNKVHSALPFSSARFILTIPRVTPCQGHNEEAAEPGFTLWPQAPESNPLGLVLQNGGDLAGAATELRAGKSGQARAIRLRVSVARCGPASVQAASTLPGLIPCSRGTFDGHEGLISSGGEHSVGAPGTQPHAEIWARQTFQGNNTLPPPPPSSAQPE